MGQRCCGRLMVQYRRRRRQFRHKAFEFAPKRSWKYKDASFLNEMDEIPEGTVPGPASTTEMNPVGINSDDLDSEEEIDTGEIRRSGALVFGERDSDDGSDVEEGFVTTPIHAPGSTHQYQVVLEEQETRDRSCSNSSLQIGRFEVMDVGEEEQQFTVSNSSHETSKLINHTHVMSHPRPVT